MGWILLCEAGLCRGLFYTFLPQAFAGCKWCSQPMWECCSNWWRSVRSSMGRMLISRSCMPYLTWALKSTVCPRSLANPKCVAFCTFGLISQEVSANSNTFLKNSFLALDIRVHRNFFTFWMVFKCYPV